jgi:glutamate 5-kinase
MQEGAKRMTELRKDILRNVKRIVVKVGTSVLTDENGRLDSARIAAIVSQVCRIKEKGIDVIIVSSGAIGGGMGILGLKARPTSISHKQAAAAIGQIQLMKLYDDFFKAKGKNIAQVLLTQDDFSNRTRHANAKTTLLTILQYHAVPIINENDTTATDEIKLGDNDRLSGLVANLVEAQLLVILSDVDGLWDQDKKIIDTVQRITYDVERLAKGTTKQTSTGGMVTKLQAAKAVTQNGAACVIANGRTEDILVNVLACQATGTLFLPQKD